MDLFYTNKDSIDFVGHADESYLYDLRRAQSKKGYVFRGELVENVLG